MLSGCVLMLAGAVAVSTLDEIKRSSFTSVMTSTKPWAGVDVCLKTSIAGLRAAGFTYRDAGPAPHEFIVSNYEPSTLSVLSPELLMMAETTPLGDGTQIQVWAHPSVFREGGSQGYLDRLYQAARSCV